MAGTQFYALPESEQALQIADDELIALACQLCGRSRDECGDAHKDWFPQRHICYATRERAAAEAQYDADHKALPFHDGTESSWAKEWSRSHPYSYRDGVTIFVASVDLNPEDHFLSGSTPAPDTEGEVEHGD